MEGQPAREETQVKRLRAVQHAAAGDDDETLRKALLDPDPMVQGDALQALATRDSGGAVEVLLGALKSGDSAARLQALQSLDQSGMADQGTVLSALHDALSDVDIAVKGYAIQALAQRGGPQAMGYLRDALRDSDPSVRLMVVDSVIGTPDGLPLLQEASSDSEESVRSSASRGLKEALAGQP